MKIAAPPERKYLGSIGHDPGPGIVYCKCF
jgi:hypothetical protein